jgi:hypothetical protein
MSIDNNLVSYTCMAVYYVRCCGFILVMSVCLWFTGCHSAHRQTGHSSTAKPILSASPNPIPAGDPDKPVASTQITWDTGDGTIGNLYVKIDREDERLVGRAPSGSMNIDWIQFDSVYEFRLYGKKRSKLLATLTVTRDD